MNPDWKKEFNKAFGLLKTTKEIEEFFGEMFTPSEYDEFIRRWQIVKMLIEETPQRDISNHLSVSVTTVSRGSRELKYGTGVLKKIYQRIYTK